MAVNVRRNVANEDMSFGDARFGEVGGPLSIKDLKATPVKKPRMRKAGNLRSAVKRRIG
jgi:hypothetical protein